jgi:hypothetical protein
VPSRATHKTCRHKAMIEDDDRRRFSCMAWSLVHHQGWHIKPVGIKPWLGIMIARRFSCIARSLVCHQGRHIKPVGIKPWSGMIPCAPSRVTHKTCTPRDPKL